MEGAILGMGNPLLDISADVPMSILTKYDVKLNNAILAEAQHMPIYQELIDNFPVQYIAGGATQNSIRVAQWMLKPGSTGYMGAIGNDEFGQTLEKCAEKDGVRAHYMKNPETPTGTCAVLVNGGERSLIANLSAANTFKVSHLDTPQAIEMVERAKLFYMAGFFLTVSVESILRVGKHAAENNKILCLNLSAPFICQFFGEQLASAMPFADFVFCNETEAATYGEVMGWGKDLPTIALKLSALPKASGTYSRTVVFTQGSEPTIIAHKGKVTEYPVPALAKELIVDTNGAGDAFVGGFLARLVEGKDIEECVRSGTFAARTVIQFSGCTFPEQCNYI
jgi:adenosine kinase